MPPRASPTTTTVPKFATLYGATPRFELMMNSTPIATPAIAASVVGLSLSRMSLTPRGPVPPGRPQGPAPDGAGPRGALLDALGRLGRVERDRHLGRVVALEGAGLLREPADE